MRVFKAECGNEGILPSEYSFAGVSDPAVLLRAVKQAEDGKHWILRVNEGAGEAHEKVKITAGEGIKSAWICNASEEILEAARVENGALIFDIAPFAPMTFRLELQAPNASAQANTGTPVRLPYNCAVTSSNTNRKNGILKGYTLPSEQFPQEIRCKDAVFSLSDAEQNALVCGGQTVQLPKGTKKAALLLTSLKGDKDIPFRSGTQIQLVSVPDFHERLGAGDLYAAGESGYLKRCTLAKEFTHLHSAAGDEIAVQTYLFYAEVDITDDTLVLPVEDAIVVFAVTAFAEPARGGALFPLSDRLEKIPMTYRRPKRENRLSRMDNLITALGKTKVFGKKIEEL